MSYKIRRVNELPEVTEPWDGPAWAKADTVSLEGFHPRGSDHRPRTQARVLHDGEAVSIIFRVEDRYVLVRHTDFQDPTHKDSCVEFFVQPGGAKGYFNLEMNAGGALLLWYVEDPKRVGGAFAKYTPVSSEWGERIQARASLPRRVDPERDEAVTWTVSYRVPLALFQAYAGDEISFARGPWRGNFYKCADDSSHPHWGYWSDIGEKLDFHQPDRFGLIEFE